jgi:soluble lytic murein transglycosylase
MSRRLLPAAIVAVVLALIITTLLFSRPATDDYVAERMPGDVQEVVAAMGHEDVPAHAAALLATDRPWRAAQVMRSYIRQVVDAPPDHRLLAARAEAGWGAWPEVRQLLDGVPALDTWENGAGVYLLARAWDDTGEPQRAVALYRAFLALSPPAGEMQAERDAALLRLGLALVRAGDRAAAQQPLQQAAGIAGGASLWLRLLEADALAATGDTAAVRQVVAPFDADMPGLRARRARIAAARAAGDIAAARALANEARAWARTDGTRSEFQVSAARAAIEMGDAATGRAALRAVIDRSAAGPYARLAAELLRSGRMTPEDHLAVARVFRAQGLHEESLDGYRRWLDARGGTAGQRAGVQMEYANALFYAHQYDDVGAATRPIANQAAARMLHARAEAHRDNPDDAVRIYLGVADQFTATAAQATYLAASVRHDVGDVRRARELYRRVIARHAGSPQMGLSMMRMAGLAFHEGDFAEAQRTWDEYRARYPRGTHAIEATYWAARAREERGDSAGAAALYRTIRQRDRDSYYALLASQRLDAPFWPLPMGAAPPASAAADQRVAAWVRGIDLLRAAGFPDEASAEVDRVVASAGTDRPTLYALAEALAERGYSQRAIRIGLRLQAGEEATNRRLLRILYPFPYRTLITEEARDRGFDPFVAAALIRQESMFEQRITSHVGARGLMQIMPATGGRIAEAAGLDRWDAELLYHPEINVHLGTRYLAQHLENYDGSLPSVFSAYNAGAHRVRMWRAFPEYGNDELFTERIPFRETRDYVRILTRNLAIYAGLYADAG